jgi:hypothetical protein
LGLERQADRRADTPSAARLSADPGFCKAGAREDAVGIGRDAAAGQNYTGTGGGAGVRIGDGARTEWIEAGGVGAALGRRQAGDGRCGVLRRRSEVVLAEVVAVPAATVSPKPVATLLPGAT